MRSMRLSVLQSSVCSSTTNVRYPRKGRPAVVFTLRIYFSSEAIGKGLEVYHNRTPMDLLLFSGWEPTSAELVGTEVRR